MKRGDFLRLLSLNVDDLFILSASGYRKVVMFHDNAGATLRVTKDEDEEDNIEVALNVIVKAIKAEVVAIEYELEEYLHTEYLHVYCCWVCFTWNWIIDITPHRKHSDQCVA